MADVSALYPQPPKPPDQSGGIANVLTNPANVLQLMQGMNALQASTQQLRARNAIGEIYRKNIRPDGTLDEHAAIRDIANNPDTAYSAPEAVGGMLQRQGQALQNQGVAIANHTSQMEQQAKAQAFTAGSFSMIDPEHPTEEQVHNWTVMMRRNFPSVPAAVINGMAQTALTDPKGLAHGVATIRNMAIGSAGTSERVSGPPDASGAPTTITKGAANLAPGAVPTGLPPGTGEAANVAGAGAGQALAHARDAGVDYPRQVFPLEQAIPALEKLGKYGTGPGTEELNHIKSFLQSAGIPGLDADKIKTFDEAKKYLTDFVNQNGNSGTNDKLAASFAGNPSVGISNAAAIDVAKSALALRRMKQAQLTAFEQSGLPEKDFSKFVSKWNMQADPRVYGFDMMTPEQRKKVLSGLPEAKQQLFMMAVQDAAEQGLIKKPQANP